MTGLRIFEKHPEADAYRFGPSFTPHAIVATEKRFTGAELAAEVWMQYADLFRFIKDGRPNTRGKFDRRATITRFATLPHYDEESS